MFDGEVVERVFAQLETFYSQSSQSFLKIQKLIKELQGQRLDAVFTAIAEHLKTETQTIPVSTGLYQRLQLADQAIAHVKAHLPFGAGNQLEAWCLTRGNARQRRDQGKAVTKFGQKEKEAIKKTLVSTGSAALVSLVTQGATCREYAALIYEYLKRQGVPEQELTINSMQTGDHVLIIFGPQNASEQTVAVDAWPTHAQALRWQDHFASDKGAKDGTLFAGDAQPLQLPDINTLAGSLIATSNAFNPVLFNFVPCCTSSFTRIIYTESMQRLSSIHNDTLPMLRNLEEEKVRLIALEGKSLSTLLS